MSCPLLHNGTVWYGMLSFCWAESDVLFLFGGMGSGWGNMDRAGWLYGDASPGLEYPLQRRMGEGRFFSLGFLVSK